MDLIFPNEGLVPQLTSILNAGPIYRLFTNNITPGPGTTKAALTEAAWAGYLAVPLTFASYIINGVSGNAGYAIAAPISFSNTSGASVTAYGYFVTDSTNTYCLAAALFDGAPVTIPNGGATQVVPTWGDFSALTS